MSLKNYILVMSVSFLSFLVVSLLSKFILFCRFGAGHVRLSFEYMIHDFLIMLFFFFIPVGVILFVKCVRPSVSCHCSKDVHYAENGETVEKTDTNESIGRLV